MGTCLIYTRRNLRGAFWLNCLIAITCFLPFTNVYSIMAEKQIPITATVGSINNKQFQLFTFQILPLSTYQHIPEYGSIEEVTLKKNEILWNILNGENFHFFRERGGDFITTKLFAERDLIGFRVARRQEVELIDKEAHSHIEDSYPPSMVVFNNDPDRQTIAVEISKNGLRPEEMKSLIEESLEESFKYFSLSIYVIANFDPADFWETVREYKGRIQSIRFEIISPNLPRVTEKMNASLKAFAESTGAHKTVIGLNAKRGDVLSIKDNSEVLSNLSEHAGAGGGEVTLKVKRIKKRIPATKKYKVLTLQDLTLQGQGLDVATTFREMMKDGEG